MTQVFFYTVAGDQRKHPIWASDREDAMAQAIVIALDRKQTLDLVGPDGVHAEIKFEGGEVHTQRNFL